MVQGLVSRYGEGLQKETGRLETLVDSLSFFYTPWFGAGAGLITLQVRLGSWWRIIIVVLFGEDSVRQSPSTRIISVSDDYSSGTGPHTTTHSSHAPLQSREWGRTVVGQGCSGAGLQWGRTVVGQWGRTVVGQDCSGAVGQDCSGAGL